MSRFTIALVASVCVVLMALATSVKAQDEIHEIHAVQTQPQSPGILERIMNDYVYPLRDYDWRGMVRRFVNGVMDYISPDAKEPKSDYGDNPYKQAQYRTSILVRRMLNRAIHYVESFLA